jgi:hypothetical protein
MKLQDAPPMICPRATTHLIYQEEIIEGSRRMAQRRISRDYLRLSRSSQ